MGAVIVSWWWCQKKWWKVIMLWLFDYRETPVGAVHLCHHPHLHLYLLFIFIFNIVNCVMWLWWFIVWLPWGLSGNTHCCFIIIITIICYLDNLFIIIVIVWLPWGPSGSSPLGYHRICSPGDNATVSTLIIVWHGFLLYIFYSIFFGGHF